MEEYIAAEMQVIKFESEDVITGSVDTETPEVED